MKPEFYIKFTGKFTDLIPNGWTFQKLFARNYRQYHKTCDGEKYSQGCRIWQHYGGYLEIDRFDGRFDYLLVKAIMDGTIDLLQSKVRNPFDTTKEDEIFWLVLDNENGVLYPHHSPEYKAIRNAEFHIMQANPIDEKAYKEHFKRYDKLNIRKELVVMLKDLVEKGWITVALDQRNA